jgi:hypothetical protein
MKAAETQNRDTPSLFCFFCFALSYFIFLFLSFPRLFPPPTCAQVPAERKKKSPECQSMTQMAAKYKESKLGSRPLREFPGNYHGKYASSSFGIEFSKYTH